MSKKNDDENLNNLAIIGDFTKYSAESFKQNIVKKQGYLEKVKSGEISEVPSEFH